MGEDLERQRSIWLEVTNVRRMNGGVQIQVKGDRADREPVWWIVKSPIPGFDDGDKVYRAVSDGLDKKRFVVANLAPVVDPAPKGTTLNCTDIRIQYAESNPR